MESSRVLWISFYIFFFTIFMAWLMYAIDNYQSLPTSSKFTLKYGDDGDKFVRYPSVTICKEPNVIFYELWQGFVNNLKEDCNISDVNYFPEPPYFLSLLENCLENSSNITASDIVQKLTYKGFVNHHLNKVLTKPKLKTPLGDSGSWQEHIDKIVHSQYHYHYGHCITVDISPLSKHHGKFPFTYGYDIFTLEVWAGVEEVMSNYIFLHNGTDIGQLGENIQGTLHYSDSHNVHTFLSK